MVNLAYPACGDRRKDFMGGKAGSRAKSHRRLNNSNPQACSGLPPDVHHYRPFPPNVSIGDYPKFENRYA
jgi:hypothetical protein